ncbi:MAG TPA: endopeptidase La [Bdellovibrionota bacterium]|nr:endopeptidase La [Bdellovibrionota bacterium]
MNESRPHVDVPEKALVLPLRNAVLFPMMKMPISVGRPRSVASVMNVGEGGLIAIVTQKDKTIDEPRINDLYVDGVLAKIEKIQKMNDQTLTVLVHGLARIRLVGEAPVAGAEADQLGMQARIERVPNGLESLSELPIEIEALVKNIKALGRRIISLSPNIPDEAAIFVESITDPDYLADLIASYMNIDELEKQNILSKGNVKERLERVTGLLNKEIDILELSKKIQGDIKDEVIKNQREYYLKEQIKVLQKELGQKDDEDEVEELKEKVKEAKMPEDVEKVAMKELDRMSRTSPNSAEHGVIRTYVEWLIDVPWSTSTKDNNSIGNAEKVLNEDHYGLEKVKKRILEYLAVIKLKADLKGPILCLAGPPGVGKTSLGKSVARALGREFQRIALGGVRDDAEIRGHRRTYVGAMPGRIIQALKRAKTNNPVILLDEIDKMASDMRGDPAAAMLEVLDPEQNNTFSDHYLDVPFDLSKVLFIATANNLETIPSALRDRLEILNIAGYTEEEKYHIATDYLVPENIEGHGLKKEQVSFEEDALKKIIHNYTREAGVRNLKREIASVCRAVAKEIADEEYKSKKVGVKDVDKFLGKEKYELDVAERTAKTGVVTGLAWTPVGGDILFIECTRMKGKGGLTLTGQLGDVMKESAKAAESWLRASAGAYGIPDSAFTEYDYHLHVPSGAIPKDGPSAGITMLTALASLHTGRPLNPKVAMTGEITLRGAVLPVGGIKEKVLAAKRAGIDTIILCHKNERDLEDIPEELRKTMTFKLVKEMSEVLKIALNLTPTSVTLPLAKDQEAPVIPPKKDNGKGKKSSSGARK